MFNCRLQSPLQTHESSHCLNILSCNTISEIPVIFTALYITAFTKNKFHQPDICMSDDWKQSTAVKESYYFLHDNLLQDI